MVFSDNRVRPKRSRQTGDAIHFEHLPDEILLSILEDLTTEDLLQVRLSNSGLTGIADTIIQTRLRTFYIHPNPTSLHQAAAIGEDGFFTKNVQEVVLLGSFSQDGTSIRSSQDLREQFSPWPALWPRKAKSVGEIEYVATKHKLVEMLSKMPNLQSIAFRSAVTAKGYNQTRTSVVESYAKRSRITFSNQLNHTDFEILLRLLKHSGNKIRTLDIGSPMPFTGTTMKLHASHRFEKSISHLRSLSINLDVDIRNPTVPGSKNWHLVCGKLLQLANNLEELTITLSGNNMHQRLPPASDSLSQLKLEDRQFPQLRRLEIVRQPDPRHIRPQRPSVQFVGDDFLGFMTRHSNRLTSVTISNVLFQSPSANVLENIKNTLRLLREAEVKRVEYFITAFRHHQWCKKAERNEPYERCRHDCSVYAEDGNGGRVGLEEFYVLAKDIGVGVKREVGEREGWDFGEGRGSIV